MGETLQQKQQTQQEIELLRQQEEQQELQFHQPMQPALQEDAPAAQPGELIQPQQKE